MTYTEKQQAERAAATKKWQDAMAKWQIAANIEAHGGPPAGPKPAYDGPSNLIEPNLAGASGGVASSDATGNGGVDAFNNGGPPVIENPTYPDNPSNGAAPGGGGPVDTTDLDKDHQRAVDAYNTFMGERDNAGKYQAPTVETRDVATPDQVNTRLIGGAEINDTQGQQVRGQQLSLTDALKARMEGRGPSVAQEQQARALDTIAQQQSGLAAQAHGNAGVFARREAMRNTADAQQKTSLDAALLRATESATAAGQLGGELQGVRATDTSTAVHQADLNQDASKANQGEAGANDRFNSSQNTSVATGNANRDVGVQTTNAGNAITAHGQNIGEKQGLANSALTASGQATDTTGKKVDVQQHGIDTSTHSGDTRYAIDKGEGDKILGGLIGGAATVGAAALTSDARAKKDIKPDSDKDVSDFLDALQEVSYRYRDPADGTGQRHGVLAQDLEKSKIGRSVVHTDTRGLRVVDTNALTMALAGVLARVAKENRRGRK